MTAFRKWAWPASPHGARLLAVSLLEYACRGNKVAESDERYRQVTEKRDFGAGYSSCADLAHWLYFRLGVRERWVNRDEHLDWVMGANVSKLAWSCPQARKYDGELLEPGDVIIVWSRPGDEHVICVIESHGDILYTAEYGQPGGALKTRKVVDGKIGHRRIQRWLPLRDVLAAAQANGRLVDADEPVPEGELP